MPCLRPLGVGMLQPRHAYPLPRESMPRTVSVLLSLRERICPPDRLKTTPKPPQNTKRLRGGVIRPRIICATCRRAAIDLSHPDWAARRLMPEFRRDSTTDYGFHERTSSRVRSGRRLSSARRGDQPALPDAGAGRGLAAHAADAAGHAEPRPAFGRHDDATIPIATS